MKRLREAEIDRVFAGQPASHAWKHAATLFDSVATLAPALVLFCVRNPLSWLLSLHRNPYHAQVDLPDAFEAFLNVDWALTRRDGLREAALKPHALYEAKLRSYGACMDQLAEAGIPFRVVRFEDIVLDQQAVFAALAPHLHQPAAAFAPVARSTKDAAKDIRFYIDYYGAERWRAEIDHLVPAMTARLDRSLFAAFGYPL